MARKARNKESKKLDLLKPINLMAITPENDPCFGKLHDPQHATCRRCGDSEICSIAKGQLNHSKRAKVEEVSNFMDIEEEGIDNLSLNKKIRKAIKNIVSTNKAIKKTQLKEQVVSGLGISEEKFEKRLKIILKNSKNITLTNGTITYTE